MRLLTTPEGPPFEAPEPPLCDHELAALRQACGPVSMLGLPPATVIHTLLKHGYIGIVLGGVQITERGLERLLRERARSLAQHAMRRDPAAVGPDRDEP